MLEGVVLFAQGAFVFWEIYPTPRLLIFCFLKIGFLSIKYVVKKGVSGFLCPCWGGKLVGKRFFFTFGKLKSQIPLKQKNKPPKVWGFFLGEILWGPENFFFNFLGPIFPPKPAPTKKKGKRGIRGGLPHLFCWHGGKIWGPWRRPPPPKVGFFFD